MNYNNFSLHAVLLPMEASTKMNLFLPLTPKIGTRNEMKKENTTRNNHKFMSST